MDSGFCDRLKSLTSGGTLALADYLGCSVQAVNQYKQGVSYPKTENLIKIAQFYGCSLDYLVGLSETPVRDESIQAVCNYTGLSDAVAAGLHKLAIGGDKAKIDMIDRVIKAILEDDRRGLV